MALFDLIGAELTSNSRGINGELEGGKAITSHALTQPTTIQPHTDIDLVCGKPLDTFPIHSPIQTLSPI
jgi:hypothetical protein